MLPEVVWSSEHVGEVTTTLGLGGIGHRRHRRRPAGRALRPGLLEPGRSQKHLRHRLLPAAEHRHAIRPLAAQARSPPSPPAPSGGWSTRSKAASSSAARWCSGCATVCSSSAPRPRWKRWPRSVPDTGGVVFVPAFVGLGAPHWDPHARGMLIGLRRGTSPAHIARAALEGIAFQVADVLDAVRKRDRRRRSARCASMAARR